MISCSATLHRGQQGEGCEIVGRHLSNNISQNIGIVRKFLSALKDFDIAGKWFYAFILPLFEYCYPVWMSAAEAASEEF